MRHKFFLVWTSVNAKSHGRHQLGSESRYWRDNFFQLVYPVTRVPLHDERVNAVREEMNCHF